ncbi:hypothetical protein GQ53DRAFT_885480, partial [Thozetella sp. PMI_491]
DKHRKEILAWLSPINFFVTQKDILSRHQKGTCEAVLQSPELNDWMLNRGAKLLCSGIPGSGKTIASSLVIDLLRNRFTPNDLVGVAGVFCDYKNKEIQNTTNLLASIWRQLAYHRPDPTQDVLDLYLSNIKQGTNPSLDEVSSILEKEASRYTRVFIVLDAADECDEDTFISLVRHLDKPIVNLMVTSRFSATGVLAGFPTLSIQAKPADMELYISSRLDSSPLLCRHFEKDASLREEVISTIVRQARNMFLMARCHVNSVIMQGSIRRVREALTRLPDDLDDTYSAIMGRIYAQDKYQADQARKLISWVLHATRSLTIQEIGCAMAIEPHDSSLDTQAIPDLDLLVSSCAGIIDIDKESCVIRFVHGTFQEYITKAPPIPPPTAQCDIAQICLHYLLFDVFAKGRCESDAFMNDRLAAHPFLLYAAQNWGKHARESNKHQPIQRLVERLLLEDQGSRQSCLQALLLGPHRYESYSQTTPKDAPGLWLASYFGMYKTAELLLKKGVSVDKEASDGSTALQVATKMGFVDMIELLLKHGASISGGSYDAIPLLESSRFGNAEAIKLLLDRGADINSKARSGRTAL